MTNRQTEFVNLALNLEREKKLKLYSITVCFNWRHEIRNIESNVIIITILRSVHKLLFCKETIFYFESIQTCFCSWRQSVTYVWAGHFSSREGRVDSCFVSPFIGKTKIKLTINSAWHCSRAFSSKGAEISRGARNEKSTENRFRSRFSQVLVAIENILISYHIHGIGRKLTIQRNNLNQPESSLKHSTTMLCVFPTNPTTMRCAPCFLPCAFLF